MNVIILLADDMGAHAGYLGTRGVRTPNIDALARQGVSFSNAFAVSPSCSPSRSSILTGMYPHSNGHWRNTITPLITDAESQFGRQSKIVDQVGVHEDIPTLVEILNANGYITALTQKFHISPPWKFPFQKRMLSADRHQMTEFFSECGDRPFFLEVGLDASHRPWGHNPLDKQQQPIDTESIEVPSGLPDLPEVRADLASYYRSLQTVDYCVGVVLETLKASGKADNTLVIFTSDQGYCFYRAKATVYDAGVRVPLIVSGSGVTQIGRFSPELACHIDYMPTILDYLGIPVPATVQGVSLKPLLENKKSASTRHYVFAESHSHGPGPSEFYPQRSVTDGRFRYHRNLMPKRTYVPPADAVELKNWGNISYQAILGCGKEFPRQRELVNRTYNRPAEELYDLHSDPDEMMNLISDRRFADHHQRMKQEMNRWMKDTNDPVDMRRVVRRQ